MIAKKNKSCLKLDIIKAFGADFDLEIRDTLFFVSENANAIIYPVGQHIAIRDLYVRDDMRKNDIMFIYNDSDVEKISAMNVSRDNNLLLVCEKKASRSCISIYNMSKINFNNITIFKPKRKVVSTQYSEIIYASFSNDGNYIATVCQVKTDNASPVLQGVVWDVQIFQPFKDDNYKPRCVFDLPPTVNKITIENKIICTSGNEHLSFWYIYANSVKEFKTTIKGLNLNKNFVDHEWVNNKTFTLTVLTDENDIIVLESETRGKVDEDDEESRSRVDKFCIKQHIVNCFDNHYITSCMLKSFSRGLVVGSSQGHLLFLERLGDGTLQSVRYTSREKQAKVVGCAFSLDHMVVGFNSNEIATISTNNIFEHLKNSSYEIKFNLVCDGFHQGPITSMSVALQRPIIVTTSRHDKTIRVWNYLTGHCEYCKIILTEKENNQEKEMDILSVAIHPNGYYLAISDKEMIRFFHLCYRELRFYNNDAINNENPKPNCSLLKFSYGGHILAAVSGRNLYLIRSYTRETLKTFETPHTGTITNLIFHEQDHYVYTIGTDGLIVEYNLFSFKMDKISTKYINYTGGTFTSYVDNNTTSIYACGLQTASKCMVTEVNIIPDIDQSQYESYVTQIEEKIHSICHIKSKRFDIPSLVTGGEEGVLSLYSDKMAQPFPWDKVKSHRTAINSIYFCKDTNLIFSTGDDGNLFIYCVYEVPDGENISFDDNKISNINQISSILDEGLGDNVLYPLNKIFYYEEELHGQKNLIAEYKKQEERLKVENLNRIKEKETELNRKRESDLRELNQRIVELKISKEAIVEDYEMKIKQMDNLNRQVLIEKEKEFNDRLDQMSNTIHDLNSKIHLIISEHEVELRKKDEEYEKKFRELENELRKKFEELKTNNDKLVEDIQQHKRLEELKFIHLDQEHEQEIAYKIEKYEGVIARMEKEKLLNQSEISSLRDQKRKLDAELQEKVTTNKNLTEEIDRNIITIQNLRQSVEIKEGEKEELKKKLKICEEALQEKTKLAGFSSKLKNVLYSKNVEVLSHYHKQQNEIGELKEGSKNIERELMESIRIIENHEKEIRKQSLLIEDLKERCNAERLNAKSKERELESLLQKVYDTFQSNDKNVIISGIRMIYNKYLTDDVVKKIDSTKLNVNIRDELEKQINFLQKSILNLTDTKIKREVIQNSEIYKKTQQNSLLIEELNKIRKSYAVLENAYMAASSDNSALKKKLENFKRKEKEEHKHSSETLPGIKKSSEFKTSEEELYRDQHSASNLKKSWKSGKVYKGNVLSGIKKDDNGAYKLNEKTEANLRLKIELRELKEEIKQLKNNSNPIIQNPNATNISSNLFTNTVRFMEEN